MENKEYRTIDKSTWGDGPWQNEPDKMQFVDEATGLPCLIVRNNAGALCGYAGVHRDHPLFGKSYNDVPEINVHGGLTFANKCSPHESEETGICHIVSEGEDDQVWWFGFDCAHCYDRCPGSDAQMREIYEKKGESWAKRQSIFGDNKYRDVDYVKGQIAGLAKQLEAVRRSEVPVAGSPIP